MKLTRLGAFSATAALLRTGCVANDASTASSKALSVTITDDSCAVSADTTPSGAVVFTLTNSGTVRNEFEILAEDKLRIVGERENLGPGTTVEYTLSLEPGTYYTACKTNMVGNLAGVKKFTVTEGGSATVSADEQQMRDTATTNYTAYVRDQAGQLLAQTKAFADLYAAGKMDEAKAAYATTRMAYERIEPTAEAFGKGIDPQSHVALMHPTNNGGQRMLRRGYNYLEGVDYLGRLDAGLFFIAFVRNPAESFIPILAKMSGDLLTEYLQHIASGLYLVLPGVGSGDEYVGQALFA